MSDKLIHGWGINDCNHIIQINEEVGKTDGKRVRRCVWICPYYLKWKGMLRRVLCPKFTNKNKNYYGCTIESSWRYFSNFIKWVDSQPNRDWQNCDLDKDLIYSGNKHYGPDTCFFINGKLNSFLLDRSNDNGPHMLGVHWNKNSKSFQAYCNNPFVKGGKGKHLGYFDSELEAHLAWKAKKHEYACALAELQDDLRVATSLRTRYIT